MDAALHWAGRLLRLKTHSGSDLPKRLVRRPESPDPSHPWPAVAARRLGALLIGLQVMACGGGAPERPPQAAQQGGLFSLDSVPLRRWGESDGIRLTTVSGMAILADSNVVVADAGAPALYILSWHADSIRQLGRAGSGPGEYRRPEVLGTTDAGEIVVRDMQQFRVTYWNPDGTLRGSTGPGGKGDGVIWAPVAVLGQGELVTTTVRYGAPGLAGSLRRLEADVAIADASVKVGRSIGSFPFADFISLYLPVGDGQMIQGPQYFGWKLHVAAGSRFVAIGAGGGHEIQTYDPVGKSLGTIVVPDKRLPLSNVERVAFIERAKSQAQFVMTSASLAPERFADSLPVFGGILATRTGVVWAVAPYWVGRSPAYMKAYSLEGAPLGELPLPGGFTPLAISDSLVAGYIVDSNDVPTIVAYRFRWTVSRIAAASTGVPPTTLSRHAWDF